MTMALSIHLRAGLRAALELPLADARLQRNGAVEIKRVRVGQSSWLISYGSAAPLTSTCGLDGSTGGKSFVASFRTPHRIG
jgi:hypothetical protein